MGNFNNMKFCVCTMIFLNIITLNRSYIHEITQIIESKLNESNELQQASEMPYCLSETGRFTCALARAQTFYRQCGRAKEHLDVAC